MKDEMEVSKKSRRRRPLTLGVDRVSNIIEQLDWNRLASCFGGSFEFDSEMKYELANELALQHGRLDEGLNGELPSELRRIKECAKLLKQQIENVYSKGEIPYIQSVSTAFKTEGKCNRNQFDAMMDKLCNIKSNGNYKPPSDLYRDCMKSIATLLNNGQVPLSLYKNSPFHKFILELDSQLPNTIFPQTHANYADDSRFRVMRDYLRSWIREKI